MGTSKDDAARFTPPEVTKIEARPGASRSTPESQPAYQIVERESQHVASIRVTCRPADISATLAVVFPEVMAHLNATRAKITGVPFTRYHGMVGEELDLEAGMPVAKPIVEKGRVKNSELPGGKTVVAWHIGPYKREPISLSPRDGSS